MSRRRPAWPELRLALLRWLHPAIAPVKLNPRNHPSLERTQAMPRHKVAKPAAVRYAWANAYPWANLFNKDGLQALTFRTDSW